MLLIIAIEIWLQIEIAEPIGVIPLEGAKLEEAFDLASGTKL
jgi:hypothetical protein